MRQEFWLPWSVVTAVAVFGLLMFRRGASTRLFLLREAWWPAFRWFIRGLLIVGWALASIILLVQHR